MIRQERSVRGKARGPQPTWWPLCLIAALLVVIVGLLETLVEAGTLQKILEALAVIWGFGLIGLWRRCNRIAFDIGRRHL
jgi:hypothetical protein